MAAAPSIVSSFNPSVSPFFGGKSWPRGITHSLVFSSSPSPLSPSPLKHPLVISSSVASGTLPAVEQRDEKKKRESSLETEGGSRLYVGNLPYSVTSSQLSKLFQEAGNVVAAEVVYERRATTERSSRGFGFVTMGSVEEAMQAIRMFNGSLLAGRTMKVNFPEVPRGGERAIMGPRIRSSSRDFVDTPYKVYAGNLAWTLTSESLRAAFEGQAGFVGAKVAYERDSGRSRGFGFVSFNSPQEAESALHSMNGSDLEGRPLRLNLAIEKVTTQGSPGLDDDDDFQDSH